MSFTVSEQVKGDAIDLALRETWRGRVVDEDELELAGAAGFLDPADVRAQAEQPLADPIWPEPQLPEGWDVV